MLSLTPENTLKPELNINVQSVVHCVVSHASLQYVPHPLCKIVYVFRQLVVQPLVATANALGSHLAESKVMGNTASPRKSCQCLPVDYFSRCFCFSSSLMRYSMCGCVYSLCVCKSGSQLPSKSILFYFNVFFQSRCFT